MKFLMILTALLFGGLSQAAISKKVARPAATSVAHQSPGAILRAAGSIHGGEAREVVSLLKVRRLTSKNKKLERIEFALGNAGQQPLEGKPGYFNLELRPGQKQIVIGFAQTLNARFEERDLRKVFAASPYVKSTQMYFEPETQSMNFILNLNKPASVRVIPMMGGKKRTARVVLDLFEGKRR